MIEFFSYDFILRALCIGILCAISCGIVGSFLVAGRQSLMSDMLAHTSLAGVGLGIFFHISPSITALFTALISALLLFTLKKQKHLSHQALTVLLLTGGIAIAVLFSHIAKNTALSFESYLFGSILTVTPQELAIFSGITVAIIITFTLLWKRFLCLVFDDDFFKSRFAYKNTLELLFMFLVALLISASLKIIGGLLISALLIISTISAQNISTRFSTTVAWSIVLNIVGVFVGIVASFYFDIPASSAIVLSLIFFFCVSMFLRKS